MPRGSTFFAFDGVWGLPLEVRSGGNEPLPLWQPAFAGFACDVSVEVKLADWGTNGIAEYDKRPPELPL